MLARFKLINETRLITVEIEKDLKDEGFIMSETERNFVRWCYRHGYIVKGEKYRVDKWAAWNV